MLSAYRKMFFPEKTAPEANAMIWNNEDISLHIDSIAAFDFL